MVSSLAPPKKTVLPAKIPTEWRPRFIWVLPIYALIVLTLIALPPHHSRQSYWGATIDKMKQLKSIKGPRIILIGGSNLAFGIDSVSLEKAFHKPVVNLGLHAALGLRYMLNQVKPHLHPGDLVIVTAEYHLLNGLANGSSELLDLISVYPQAASALSLEHSETLLKAVPKLIKTKMEWWSKFGFTTPGVDGVYKRDKFNTHGDLILTPADSGRGQHLVVIDFDSSRLDNINLLKDLSSFSTARGAKVYFAFTPISLSNYERPGNKSSLADIAQTLQNQSGCTVLGRPEDNLYPDSDFFDFTYHLTPAGKAVRTRFLIRDLKLALQNQDNAGP